MCYDELLCCGVYLILCDKGHTESHVYADMAAQAWQKVVELFFTVLESQTNVTVWLL